ncbi:charged multivesicular body protein 2b-B [Bemisia tabaci]|uniref:charged multivesicular body protein 2b-B n=1 Tax=Bemisia tabaci TaxID=7038 RepID=UPI0008F9D6A4|nr:PREDICTED: charged multivesicular body protein 2b-B-like [Bemisia tabaci]XP_018898837.1 PREDICTED: charged multivesicular body protein 2b-B-like [Bemisia tabaci]
MAEWLSNQIFGKPPTIKDLTRENDKAVRKAGREIEKDRRVLEREEKKLEAEIKKAAKENDKDACTILAKQLVALRKQKTRSYAANTKLQSVGNQTKLMGANMKLAETMSTTSKSMQKMNNILKPEQVMGEMNAFSQAVTKMNMTDDMINDTLNDILDESGDEEESDAIVNQVLDEIGIEISGHMSKAPSVSSEKVSSKSKAKLPTDEEIEAQLAKLLKTP